MQNGHADNQEPTAGDGLQWLPAEGERPAGIYLSAGGPMAGIKATLRVAAVDLDPDEVTRILGCEPTESHRRGDPVDKSGRGARRAGSWRLVSSLPQSATLNEHIAHLFGAVSSDLGAWKRLERCDRDIFCGLFMSTFNQGDVLSPECARQLADRGVSLGFDIYGPPTDE